MRAPLVVLLLLAGCSFPDLPIVGRACDLINHLCTEHFDCVAGACQPAQNALCDVEGATVPCVYNALGVCAETLGARMCRSGTFRICSAPAPGQGSYQTLETLCDGLDNDCDGTTDSRGLLLDAAGILTLRLVPWEDGFHGTYAVSGPDGTQYLLFTRETDAYLGGFTSKASPLLNAAYAELDDVKVARVGDQLITLVYGRHLGTDPLTLELYTTPGEQRRTLPSGGGLGGEGVLATMAGSTGGGQQTLTVLWPNAGGNGVQGVVVDESLAEVVAPRDVTAGGPFPSALALSSTSDGSHAVFGWSDTTVHLQRLDSALTFEGAEMTWPLPPGYFALELALAPSAAADGVSAAWSEVDPTLARPASITAVREPLTGGARVTLAPDSAHPEVIPSGLWLTSSGDGSALLGWTGQNLSQVYLARLSATAGSVTAFPAHSFGNSLSGVNAGQVFDVPASHGGAYRLGVGRSAFLCVP